VSCKLGVLGKQSDTGHGRMGSGKQANSGGWKEADGCRGKQKRTTVEGKGGNNLLCCLPDTCNNSHTQLLARICFK